MLTIIIDSSCRAVKHVTPETYATNANEQVGIRKAVAAAQRKGSSDFKNILNTHFAGNNHP